MMLDTFQAVGVSVTIWTTYYFIIRFIGRNRSAEFCCRIVALTHGSSVAFMGLNQCFSGEVSPIYTPEVTTTNFQKFIIVWSLGYFLFDLGWCIAFQSETKLMIAHHLCSVIALTIMLTKENSGGQATCCLGALEITNPCLQTRWFVRTFGYHKSPLFHSVEILYVIMFLLIRIVIGTYYLVVVIVYGNTMDYLLITCALYTISLMFVYRILQYMNAKYRQLIQHWHQMVHHEDADSSVLPQRS